MQCILVGNCLMKLFRLMNCLKVWEQHPELRRMTLMTTTPIGVTCFASWTIIRKARCEMKLKLTLRSVSIGTVEDVECDLPVTATQEEIMVWAREHFKDYTWLADWSYDPEGDDVEVLDATVHERKLAIYRHSKTGVYAAVEIVQELDDDDWEWIDGGEVTDSKTQAEWAAEVDGATVSEGDKTDYPYDPSKPEYELVGLQVIG